MRSNLKGSLDKTKKFVKKYSPEILTGVSIVTGIVATVWACKKTLDFNEEIAPINDEINSIKKAADYSDVPADRKELAKVYGKAVKVAIVNYAGPVGLGLLSIISNGASVHISREQFKGVEAAAIIMSNEFARYRKNVVEDAGEEKDYMYYHDLKEETVEVVKEDPETGKKKKVKETVLVKKNPNSGLSSLAIEFGPSNPNWNENPIVNQAFLKGVETYANELYSLSGTDEYFMDKIYEALGYEKKDLDKHQRHAARVMGWSKKKDPNKKISIGIFEPINKYANDAVDDNNEYGEAVYWLDFNVDGYIADDYEEIN